MDKTKFDMIPEQEREALALRVKKLRSYFGMSWSMIGRTIFKEFGYSFTHPTIKRIHELTGGNAT